MTWTSMKSLFEYKRSNPSCTKSYMVTITLVCVKERIILDAGNLSQASWLDCIRYANGHVISKSSNGRIEIWEADTEKASLGRMLARAG